MRSYLKKAVRQRVIAHTKDKHSIRGVLVGEYQDCIVLEAPEYLGEASAEELSGRAVVLRENLGWLQVLGG